MSRTKRTSLLLAAALAAVGLLPAPAARADGDPASDILPYARAFYSQSNSHSARKSLDRTLAGAARAGYPIRVAIISGRDDLGAVGSLDGQPARYAAFLSYEDSSVVKDPILIVMPAGFGLALKGKNLPVTSLASLRPETSGRAPDSLAAQADLAVRRLAAAAGHPITSADAASASKGGGSSTALVVGLVVLVVVLAVGGSLALRLRRRAAAAAAASSSS